MKTGLLKIFLLVVISIFTYVAFLPSGETLSQINKEIIVSDKNEQTTLKSEVRGMISPINYNGQELKEFALSQPLPKIWLILKENKSADAVEVEISEDAGKILYQHWLKALRYRYLTEIEENLRDFDGQKEDSILLQSTHDTKKLLYNTPIEPTGNTGNFSSDEASQLMIFIRDASDEVIQEIKKIKN